MELNYSSLRLPCGLSVCEDVKLISPRGILIYPFLTCPNSSHTLCCHLTTHHDNGNHKRHQNFPVLRYPRREIRCPVSAKVLKSTFAKTRNTVSSCQKKIRTSLVNVSTNFSLPSLLNFPNRHPTISTSNS